MTALWPHGEGPFRDLDEKVGVEPGFVALLYDEADWSFINGLHTLFEAAYCDTGTFLPLCFRTVYFYLQKTRYKSPSV